jgi:hypothetical protein
MRRVARAGAVVVVVEIFIRPVLAEYLKEMTGESIH